MPDALQTIDEVSSRATAELAAVRTADQLEQWRIRYLGSNGEIKNLPQLIKTAPPDQKKTVGQRAIGIDLEREKLLSEQLATRELEKRRNEFISMVVHELVHTLQYERFGGFRPFLEEYLFECITPPGYPFGPLEQEAKRIEHEMCT